MDKDALYKSICSVIRDWKLENGFPIWPGNTEHEKSIFVETCLSLNFVIPLIDSKDQLAGFLFFYRSYKENVFVFDKRYDGGSFLCSDCLWIRPDLRNGETIKELIFKALNSNSIVMGSDYISFERYKNGKLKKYRLSFPKFYQRFLEYGKRKYNG